MVRIIVGNLRKSDRNSERFLLLKDKLTKAREIKVIMNTNNIKKYDEYILTNYMFIANHSAHDMHIDMFEYIIKNIHGIERLREHAYKFGKVQFHLVFKGRIEAYFKKKYSIEEICSVRLLFRLVYRIVRPIKETFYNMAYNNIKRLLFGQDPIVCQAPIEERFYIMACKDTINIEEILASSILHKVYYK